MSPAANIISPQTTHRAQSPKRSVIGPQFSSNTISSSSNDTIGQQYFSSMKSAGEPSQVNNSQTYKQTNGVTMNENGNLTKKSSQ
jgi:hypothetical protein